MAQTARPALCPITRIKVKHTAMMICISSTNYCPQMLRAAVLRKMASQHMERWQEKTADGS